MAKHNELPEREELYLSFLANNNHKSSDGCVWVLLVLGLVMLEPKFMLALLALTTALVLWVRYADMFICAALILMVLTTFFPPDMFVWALIILAVVVFNVYIVARAARLHRRHGRKSAATTRSPSTACGTRGRSSTPSDP